MLSARKVAAVMCTALAATMAIAGPAWAPSTSDSRFIKITASTANGAGVNTWTGTLTLDFEAPGVENRLTESKPSDRRDRSTTQVILRDEAGATMASFWTVLDAQAKPRGGVRTQTEVDSSYDPPPGGNADRMVLKFNPWISRWHSDARDRDGHVVVANDTRLELGIGALRDGVRVEQSVRAVDDHGMSIDFSVFCGDDGTACATGHAALTIEQRVEDPYVAGPTTFQDTDRP